MGIEKRYKRCRTLKVVKMLVLVAICLPSITSESVQSVTTTVGEPATLPCVVNEIGETVAWTYHNFFTGREKNIYSRGEVVNGNYGRFELESTDGKMRNLKLLSSRKSDAGLYRCTDKDGLGLVTHIVLLNVVGVEPVQPAPDVTTTTDRMESSTLSRREETCICPNDSDDRKCIEQTAIICTLVAVTGIVLGSVLVVFVPWQRKEKKTYDEKKPQSGALLQPAASTA